MSAALFAKQLCQLLLLVLLLLLPLSAESAVSRLTISILVPEQLLIHPPVRLAVNDAVQLLSRSFPQAVVTLNTRSAAICLQLPETIPISNSPTVPDQAYHWRSRSGAAGTRLRLSATTAEGVAAGIYGLLQEQLRIRFIHPRQTVIPLHRRWPIKPDSSFAGTPRFANRGFHLHTLHPTELTEQLHNPDYPQAFDDVTAYLDWLARNGQNTFQFFLLRGIDRDRWPLHAGRIIDYAHSRGIRCGVEISLAMLQQQAFQTITLLRPFPTYRKQVEQTLAWLFQAPWDFITLESMMGEHLPLMSRLLPGPQRHLEQLVIGQYRRPLLYATHVISDNQQERVRRPLHPASGILIHTVMCWSASETKAPVYGNRNQRFMLEAARTEVLKRETWYWPESSYWVGFDSPVPLLLLPYLDSRWEDINTMQAIGLQGHLTFSSGWEWGYWLVDWSIARWSWAYRDDGRIRASAPLARLADLFPDPVLATDWQRALTLQNHYLKELELLRYMAAATPFAELPAPFMLPFQPSPDISPRQLLRNADDQQARLVLNGPVAALAEYAQAMDQITGRLVRRILHHEKRGRLSPEQFTLAEELITGLQVTALRARHRNLTLRALLAKKRQNLGGEPACTGYLAQAAAVRSQALLLVRQQENRYRYPIALLAERRTSLTAYPFGYLYPVASLFFWEREEEQIRHERFDPLFMKLWDIRRTLGLSSTFIR